MSIEIEVNGARRTLNADPDMPLLWVLRDELDLKGVKFGCGAAYCGACTVMVDGVAVRSCQIPLKRIGARKITTIEGVAASPVGARVQAAWLEIDVAQCGYCQAGQIKSAACLLRDKPDPTDKDIDDAMGGNLCRCATYFRIRKGIHRAAELAAGKEAVS